MRIALCIAGQWRTHLNCRPTWEEHYKNLKMDTFIHTWAESGPPMNEKLQAQELQNLTGAVAVEVEEQMSYYEINGRNFRTPEFMEKLEPRHSKNTLNMLRGIWRCDQLRQNYEERTDQKYDIVIRTRPDLNFFGPRFKVPKIKANSIYLEACFLDIRYLRSDKLAVADSNTMKRYTEIYRKIPDYWANEPSKPTWDQILSDERLIKHHLEQEKIDTQICPSLFFLRRQPQLTCQTHTLERIKSIQRLARNYIYQKNVVR